jgi:hypothetical protein
MNPCSRLGSAIVVALSLSACGGESPTAPAPPTPTPPAVLYVLTGVIMSAAGGPVVGASGQ